MAGWTDWMTENANGSRQGPVALPSGNSLVAIQVREQSGFGVVDARLGSIVNGQIEYSDWLCHNSNGFIRTAVVLQGIVDSIVGYEQPDFGIVELGLGHDDAMSIEWTTYNHQGMRKTIHFHLDAVKAMECREQPGFGIVDIRFKLR